MTIEFFFRLLLAGVLGTIIGLDREYRAKEAGYRTHFLVSLGSALIMIVSQYGFSGVLGTEGVSLDPGRIASQVVTGIGFIGAGTIVLHKHMVRGLTTAAGIWATAAIGLAIGAGLYWLGVSATLLTLVALELLSFIFKKIEVKNSLIEFTVGEECIIAQVRKMLDENGYHVTSYQMSEDFTNNKTCYRVSLLVKSKRVKETSDLLSNLTEIEGVSITRVE